jgi:CHAT domain-containing protein/tetratricopeptide (TPR) repeat protein
LFNSVWRSFRPRIFLCAWLFLLLLLIPLKDNDPGRAKAEYDHVLNIFQRGELAKCQQEAEQEFKEHQVSNPEWAAKFQLLEADAMVLRGMFDNGLRLLANFSTDPHHPDNSIRKLAIEASALAHQQQLSAADQKLSQAERFCKSSYYESCGAVLRARGYLAIRQGNLGLARRFYLDTLAFSQTHHDRFLEAGASLNLGYTALQYDRYDEAIDWSQSALRLANDLGAEGYAQIALGNLGWAYYQLGDDERALELFLEAEQLAARLGDLRGELKWIGNAGAIYHDTGDLNRAVMSYRHALELARQIGSKEDTVDVLEDLSQNLVDSGKLDEASSYLDQAISQESAGDTRFRAYIRLTQGMLAAARRQNQQAETFFRAIQNNPANPTSIRFSAGDELAGLYEKEGNAKAAEQMYKATLIAFESAQSQLKRENSRLPYSANAFPIYDDYIHLLVKEGKSEEALTVANQSRARTLAQDLGVTMSKTSLRPAALNPRQIAQQSVATLLFYWLGAKQSYLWAITPAKIIMVRLPEQTEIIARVKHYRKALLDLEDPLKTGNPDGEALYQTLVAPAAKLIRPQATVMILADGALSQLNFETLLAPGPGQNAGRGANSNALVHYWIEDATLLSAPSLDLLAAAKPARNKERNLLLLGNPVSPSPDYPTLPLFGAEMIQIKRHFAANREVVFTGAQATPAVYLHGNPAQFNYIHFVSHTVTSRIDPLESAIILSESSPTSGNTGEASFKLYAREIMQHPIDARLVTISACYGSGTRSYAGEGLVGLSWAFLRAGAHNVIGALWEVSDNSTPQLMDSLYQGMEEGQAPAVALRNAKLGLLHSQSRFTAPFFWAPFQIYTKR